MWLYLFNIFLTNVHILLLHTVGFSLMYAIHGSSFYCLENLLYCFYSSVFCLIIFKYGDDAFPGSGVNPSMKSICLYCLPHSSCDHLVIPLQFWATLSKIQMFCLKTQQHFRGCLSSSRKSSFSTRKSELSNTFDNDSELI